MPYQVLSTKLFIPPLQASLVARPRLVQALETGYISGRRLSLVCAPAGFGKTTLVREWLGSAISPRPFGWLSLDDGDNDPVRFLIYLVSALQKVAPALGQSVMTALNSPQVPPLLELVEALINEISLAPQPFLVILDDFHLVKKPEVHALLQFLLKQQPEPLHLVVITREDPPFALPRMRVQGLVTEIRERDLRFSLPEAHSFLVKTMGLALSPEDVGRLEERTEGWAAGMQLAALALEEFPDTAARHAFIEAFSGDHRLIFDYLISEVLQRQDEVTRSFLLRTSVLERFCAGLCDQVVFEGQAPGSSQPLLEALENANMFLVPLDSQRRWYRYHHLFSEMLRHSLLRLSPGLVPDLHRQASRWFEDHSLIPEAFQHSLAAQDWQGFRSLMDRFAMPIIFPGYGRLVIDWCQQIPRALLESTPDICIHFAWALVLTFRDDYMERVQEYLQMAERALARDELPDVAPVGEGGSIVPFKDWIAGHIYTIRSQVLLGHLHKYIDPHEEIALSLKGLERLPEVERTTRSICRINLGHAQTMQNHPVEAQEAFSQALPSMLESGNFLGAVAAIFYMARLAIYREHIDRGEAVLQHWKKTFAEISGPGARGAKPLAEIPATRGLDIVQGLVLLERGQVSEAESVFVQSLDMLGWGSWMELHGFVELARLRQRQGNFAGVQEVLDRMRRLGPQHSACAEALKILFALQKEPNDPQVRQHATAWAVVHAPAPSIPLALGIGPYHRDTEYICNLAWARVQIALANFEQAVGFVQPALEIALERGLHYRTTELSVYSALVFAGRSDLGAALRELERALSCAEKGGYSRCFEDDPQLDRLLQLAVEKKIHASFAARLLSGRKLASRSAQAGLVDPLSERELEVLRLLAAAMSPVEIAQKLYLSPYTLKAHTQNIYSKLGVHSRLEAINKARELSLL
jgi:LuxR family transcriptional regulator, maltose regulon positive regulatory protein